MIFETGGVTAQDAYEAQILRYCNGGYLRLREAGSGADAFLVAAVAFLLYDLLIHLGDEVSTCIGLLYFTLVEQACLID